MVIIKNTLFLTIAVQCVILLFIGLVALWSWLSIKLGFVGFLIGFIVGPPLFFPFEFYLIDKIHDLLNE